MSNNLLESEEKGHYECEASLLFSVPDVGGRGVS